MEYHYKAFISYRHAELDTKVAVEIQNRIERTKHLFHTGMQSWTPR